MASVKYFTRHPQLGRTGIEVRDEKGTIYAHHDGFVVPGNPQEIITVV